LVGYRAPVTGADEATRAQEVVGDGICRTLRRCEDGSQQLDGSSDPPGLGHD
jgi:hypothetical protein